TPARVRNPNQQVLSSSLRRDVTGWKLPRYSDRAGVGARSEKRMDEGRTALGSKRRATGGVLPPHPLKARSTKTLDRIIWHWLTLENPARHRYSHCRIAQIT